MSVIGLTGDTRGPSAGGERSDILNRAHRAPDDQLLSAMSAGDSDAAHAFVRRFQRVVFGVAYAAIGDAGLAEDVAQQAFEHAWRQADLYDPRRGSVRAWLTSIAHNLAVDTARMRRATPIAPPDLTPLIGAITHGPEHDGVTGETAAELAQALAALPPEQAKAVVMAAAHGFTAREIAETEDIPLATAKSRIRIALEKLHDALPPRGDSD
jgi:RNA polymerase sigma-70 factor (ECF subfamily)